jgi:hypothetical protein
MARPNQHYDAAQKKLHDAADSIEGAARAVALAAANCPQIGGEHGYHESDTTRGRPRRLSTAAKFAQNLATKSSEIRWIAQSLEDGD